MFGWVSTRTAPGREFARRKACLSSHKIAFGIIEAIVQFDPNFDDCRNQAAGHQTTSFGDGIGESGGLRALAETQRPFRQVPSDSRPGP